MSQQGVLMLSKKEIYSIMNKLTEEGDAVIMVSSELPEVLGMSDRVLVIHEGKVGGILEKDEASQESIMALATGRVRMAKKECITTTWVFNWTSANYCSNYGFKSSVY